MTQTTRALPRWIVLTQIVSLVIIGVLGFLLTQKTSSAGQKQNTYPFLAKRILIDNPNDTIVNFIALRKSLRQYEKSSADTIGVYFEYLPTGTSINANGNEDFFRASLVKLPVVMRAYKFIDQGVLSLDDVLTIEEKQLNQEFGELWKRGAGTKITVRELITLILRDSDNTAFNVLYERVNVQLLDDRPSGDRSSDDVYDYLDIPRAEEGTTPMITPKNFASILKSVYFSAYLPLKYSNEILHIMTEPHSQEWLRASIPDTIAVAHKIGLYAGQPEPLHVHSDCGIVYYPLRPYLLCVMVKSDNTVTSSAHIRDISDMVYSFIHHL